MQKNNKIMVHKINVKCDKCKVDIVVYVDDNFNIINVEYPNITKNKCSLRCKDIEFGLLKEGENRHNAS